MEDFLVPTPTGPGKLSQLNRIEKSREIDYLRKMTPEERNHINLMLDTIHELDALPPAADPKAMERRAEIVRLMRENISLRILNYIEIDNLLLERIHLARLRKMANK